MVTAPAGNTPYDIKESAGSVILSTPAMTASVSLTDGNLVVKNRAGEVLLKSVNSGEFAPVTADPAGAGKYNFAIHQQWNTGSDEGFYGLGQHQDGRINHAGDNVELSTHNLQISIPFVVSTKHYGILWDNAAITRFGNPVESAPLNAGFALYDEDGNAGGLTAYYYDKDKLLLKRTEAILIISFLLTTPPGKYRFLQSLVMSASPGLCGKGRSARSKADFTSSVCTPVAMPN